MWILEDKHMIITALAILFGAVVHATAQLKISRDEKKQFWVVDFTILFLIACFSWTVFGLVSTIFFDSQITIILWSSIGAFLWLTGLNKISNIILEFLLTKVKDDTKN